MLSTVELEKYVTNQIKNVLPEANLRQINFCAGKDNSPEGTYIFESEGKYHFLFTEKGKIRIDKESDDISEIIWNLLDIVLFDIAMEYALKNKQEGKDFRRALFEREIELYSMFGNCFRERKVEEIGKILEENPYID